MARVSAAFEGRREFREVGDGHVDPDVVGAVRVDGQAELGGFPLRGGAVSPGEADEEKLLVRGSRQSRQCRRPRATGMLA